MSDVPKLEDWPEGAEYLIDGIFTKWVDGVEYNFRRDKWSKATSNWTLQDFMDFMEHSRIHKRPESNNQRVKIIFSGGDEQTCGLISNMLNTIQSTKFKLIEQNNQPCTPKLICYVGQTEWAALKAINPSDVLPLDLSHPNMPKWIGVEVIRVVQDDYFKVYEQKEC